jgi:hypothetical protein
MAYGMGLNAVVAFDLILGRAMVEEAMAVIAWEGISSRFYPDWPPQAIMRAIDEPSLGVGIASSSCSSPAEGGFVVKAAARTSRS